MNRTGMLLVATLSCAMLTGACTKKDESPIESAVDHTKDALDVRDHEAVKDAAEDVKDAASNVGEAVKDAASDVEDAVRQD